LSSLLLIFFSLIFLAPGPAPAKETLTLKLAHQWVQGDIRDNWARNFIAAVQKKTDGAVKIELHAGGVLFKPQTQFDALRRGALDLCVWPFGYTSGTYPLLTLTDLPAVIPNPERGLQFSRSEAGRRLEAVAEEAGLRILSWGWLPTSIGSKGRFVRVPADVRGLKMRAAVKPVEMVFQSAGAAITTMPSSEVYMALQTGALDAFFTTDSSFLSFRLHDVIQYLTLGKNHCLMNGSFSIVLRQGVFRKLPPDVQRAFSEAGEESAKEFLKESNRISAELEKVFKEKGVKVTEMTEPDYQAWVEVAKKSSWKWFREEVKGGSELLDMALREMK
jgi:TRAP-type transport system periplasmic protein